MSKPIIAAPKSTGSTEPRDIRNRFADFLNVKDFGAVGDGVTDDTSAFSAAAVSGRPVYVPHGNYNIPTDVQGKFFSLGGVEKTGVGSVVVNDLISKDVIQIYADSENGDDNNDGLTLDTAVKTLPKAYELSTSLNISSKDIPVINLAAGTYTGITQSRTNLLIRLLGDVSISSYSVVEHSFLRFAGQYTVTFTGSLTFSNNSSGIIIGTAAVFNSQTSLSQLHVGLGSFLQCVCPLSITRISNSSSARAYALDIGANSTVRLNSTLDITTDYDYALVCATGSVLTCDGKITITSSHVPGYIINITDNSYFQCIDGLVIDKPANSTASNSGGGINVGGGCVAYFVRLDIRECLSGGIALCVIARSLCFVTKDTTITGSTNADCIDVSECSLLQISASATGTCTVINKYQTGTAINILYESNVQMTSGKLIIQAPNGSSTAITTQMNSFCHLLNFSISGTYSDYVLYVRRNSLLVVVAGSTITGTGCTGKKYYIGTCSLLDLNGINQNNLPGTVAGEIQANSYSAVF